MLFIGISAKSCLPGQTVPEAVYAVFMMMFAVISPILMTGAFAERMRFAPALILMVAWEILVFYPVANWIWSPAGGWLAKQGVLDFAGGIVIHTTAGASSLVVAKMLGHRKGFDDYEGEFPYSNIPLAVIGAGLLWIGWFGFNAGSALQAGAVAVSTVVNTQAAAAMSGFVWLVLSWWRHRPSTIAVINGVIAGLAGVTPASGYIAPPAAIILGVLLGFSSFFGAIFVKHTLRIDDALDVSAVHGLTGVVGSIFIGFASQTAINGNVWDGVVFGGSGSRVGWQILAVLVCGVWAAGMTWLIMLSLNAFYPGGTRVAEEHEDEGLDLVEHGEEVIHPVDRNSGTKRASRGHGGRPENELHLLENAVQKF